MSNELKSDGPELQPVFTGEFAVEEAASEDAGHLLPSIRELPQDREFVPGAFYSVRLSNGAPPSPAPPLGESLGASVFQTLTDIHLFGRNSDSDPWIEAGPQTSEPIQLLVAQELFTPLGQPLAEDDLGMFDMVAGRIAKTLGRTKQPPAENAAAAASRSGKLASLKGKFSDAYELVVIGKFEAGKVIDCALCLGMRRLGDKFGWFGALADEPTFTVTGEPTALKAAAKGPVSTVHLRFVPAKVAQPGKVLERMFTAGNYFVRRIGGKLQKPGGAALPETLVRGEDPALSALVKKVTDQKLKPGNVVARRLA